MSDVVEVMARAIAEANDEYPNLWRLYEKQARDVLSAVEAAIRADEAAKVRAATIEEAEELLFGMMRRDKLHGPEWMEAMLAARGAIRALEEKK
jgi:hypothetical protein